MTEDSVSMQCSDELPQQFQSVSSRNSMPSSWKKRISEALFSWAVVAREQPGKYEKRRSGVSFIEMALL